MPTELYVSGPISFLQADDASAEDYDRVQETAADRAVEDTFPAVPDPAGDHGDFDRKLRREDVEEKHRRICEYLDETRQDGIILGRADSVAWFTSGGDLTQDLCSEAGSILLFINRKCRAVIADNVQSGRIFEEELAGLGFQLKERAWFDDPQRIVDELSHNKQIASDLRPESCPQWRTELDPIRALRRTLTPLERGRLRDLGSALTQAVETTCRTFEPGEREADVAGRLAHRLIREGMTPVALRVASDDRLSRFRQPTFKAEPIRRRATITVTARRHGLCASMTRTVSFGLPEPEFRASHTLAAMVDATCIHFSKGGEPVSEVMRRARRIYEKFDAPHEWTLDYQGVLIGYSPREALLTPDSRLRLEPGMAVCWNPSVLSARSEDTIVVDSEAAEVVTRSQSWPMIDISVKGCTLPRPGILER